MSNYNDGWNDVIEVAMKRLTLVSGVVFANIIKDLKKTSNVVSVISKGLDDAISDELANPPKLILKE